MPGGIGRPCFDINRIILAEPGCIGVMLNLLRQPKLPLEENSATAGINDPACPYFALTTAIKDLETMIAALRLEPDLFQLSVE